MESILMTYIVLLDSAASKNVNWTAMIVVPIVIGLIVGLIRALVLKGQLTSVYKNDSAADYTRENSFKLEINRDMFLYSKTEKEAKPEPQDQDKKQ